jgi:hypothetical protein
VLQLAKTDSGLLNDIWLEEGSKGWIESWTGVRRRSDGLVAGNRATTESGEEEDTEENTKHKDTTGLGWSPSSKVYITGHILCK